MSTQISAEIMLAVAEALDSPLDYKPLAAAETLRAKFAERNPDETTRAFGRSLAFEKDGRRSTERDDVGTVFYLPADSRDMQIWPRGKMEHWSEGRLLQNGIEEK